MAQTRKETTVKPVEKVKINYRVNSALFGLLQWEEIQKTERIGSELWIQTSEDVHTVIINGNKITI